MSAGDAVETYLSAVHQLPDTDERFAACRGLLRLHLVARVRDAHPDCSPAECIAMLQEAFESIASQAAPGGGYRDTRRMLIHEIRWALFADLGAGRPMAARYDA